MKMEVGSELEKQEPHPHSTVNAQPSRDAYKPWETPSSKIVCWDKSIKVSLMLIKQSALGTGH